MGRAKHHYELWEEEYKEGSYDNRKRLLLRVQDYVTKRRLEANLTKGKGEPMDITEMNQGCGHDHGECEE